MTDRPSFPIVVVGASAGGVEALESFFRPMPADSGAAFIVATHLSPSHGSLLPEILARVTTMPITPVAEAVSLEENHVYVITPNTVLTVAGRTLMVRERAGERNIIDILMTALAQEAGDRAIGIILSGTGSDGAIGITALREAGGFTLVQGSTTSRPGYSGMPDTAISTGAVDCVLPVEDMPDRIVRYVLSLAGSRIGEAGGADGGAGVTEAMEALYVLLRTMAGHDFSRYKNKTFLRRVERRMHVRQIDDLSAYVDFVRTDPEEVHLLFRDLLIGVTNFFRDAESFQALQERVIPRLFEGKRADDVVRVWVPGCATGEEAYSIAILLQEWLDRMDPPVRIQIFASDLDERALSTARLGQYPERLLENVSPERVARFFTSDGTNCTVVKSIRDVCLFSLHSLIRDPPFSQLDLISCRNLLIYLDVTLQNQVIPLFHYALRSGGFLFLGPSENIGQHGALFSPIDKKHRVFQRRSQVARTMVFPLLPQSGWLMRQPRDVATNDTTSQDLARRVESRMIEKHAPAHVVVNRDGEVVHFSAHTGRYLEAPAGAPSSNLMSMVRDGLRHAVRSTLQETIESRGTVTREGITFDVDGGQQTVSLVVEPINEPGREEGLWLCVFRDVGPTRFNDRPAQPVDQPAHDQSVTQLERELQQTRERLQTAEEEHVSSLEELKSANEELQSVNEELQSTNEELATSKEELQSVNEELQTVNIELMTKVEETDRANSDLRNLFDSTRIATIFLDRDMTIRSFTPAISEIFKLIQSDRGRPLSDIASLLDYGSFSDDVRTTIDTLQTIEKNISHSSGQSHYLVRILPYRTVDNRIDGASVTFINVTRIVEAERKQRLLVDELNHRVKNILAVVSSMVGRMVRRYASFDEFAAAFGTRIMGLAKTHELLSESGWCDVDLGDLVRAEIAPFTRDDVGRVAIAGPGVALRPRTATALGMVIHEMTTNALKYGALSVPDGRLQVDWRPEAGEHGQKLVLRWSEKDGPPVSVPTHKGFGSEMIARSLGFELNGTSAIDYQEDGIKATFTIPADEDLMLIREG
ncbi:MAG: PAS domain-containing protein [Alphaproteobacteria bacterium]